MVAAGCSSEGTAPADECVGSGAAALKTCAAGATIKGVDVSYYQGNVSWSQVKAAGHAFAIVRVSDGLNYPDTRWTQNWSGTKSAGLVRGAYQFFRPSQDAGLQAKLVIDKLAALGGLEPGDLPPVLDLETDDGLAPSIVVMKAQKWLTAIELATGVKPIVYTAAFMSSVIGTHLSAYPLWVANYGVICPTMPSGWTDWQFWQSGDSGNVSGIKGGVDTDLFNGTLAQLQTYTVKNAPPPATPPPQGGFVADDDVIALARSGALSFGDDRPKVGSQGAAMGDNKPSDTHETERAPITRCR
jgi:lysozyme